MTINRKDPNSLIAEENPERFSISFTAKAVLNSVVAAVVFVFLFQESLKQATKLCKSLGEKAFILLAAPSSTSDISPKTAPMAKTSNKVTAAIGEKHPMTFFDKDVFIFQEVTRICDLMDQSIRGLLMDPKIQEKKMKKAAENLKNMLEISFSLDPDFSSSNIKEEVIKDKKVQIENALNKFLDSFLVAVFFKATFEESISVADLGFWGRFNFDNVDNEWASYEKIAKFLMEIQQPESLTIERKAIDLFLEQVAMQRPLSAKECVEKIKENQLDFIQSQNKGLLTPKGVNERSL